MLLVRNFERIVGQPNCGWSRPHSLKPMAGTVSKLLSCNLPQWIASYSRALSASVPHPFINTLVG